MPVKSEQKEECERRMRKLLKVQSLKTLPPWTSSMSHEMTGTQESMTNQK